MGTLEDYRLELLAAASHWAGLNNVYSGKEYTKLRLGSNTVGEWRGAQQERISQLYRLDELTDLQPSDSEANKRQAEAQPLTTKEEE